MTLRLVGAGWPRTGTGSVKLAYEQLGLGACHHMREVLMNVASTGLWLDAAAGHPDWPATFEGYTAAVDTPACMFWRELAAYYPDAKILLTVRDPEEWFRSIQETVLRPGLQARMAGTPLQQFFETVAFRDYEGRNHDHDFLVAAFARHVEAVRRAVPAERLLVYNVAEGWEPLCAFLGVAVPDAPFPHTNTRAEMAAMFAAGPPGNAAQIQERARRQFGRPNGSK